MLSKVVDGVTLHVAMNTNYKITFKGFDDLTPFIRAHLVALEAGVEQAVQQTAKSAALEWVAKIDASRMWAGDKKKYAESIGWRSTGFAKAEVTASFDKASDYETGLPERDLKKMLDTSNKVRVVKKGRNQGKKYLIIPFRHNVDSMPANVLNAANKLSKSYVTGQRKRLSGTGAHVDQLTYKWGGKLQAGLSSKLKAHHKSDIHAGMVRFNTSSGKSNSSAYLTFRIMGEWSNGWIVPKKDGLYLLKGVAEAAQVQFDAAMGVVMSYTLTKS